MSQITIFTRTADPYSVRLKEFLRRKGLPFEEVVISDDDAEAYQRLVDETGESDVPQMIIDGKHIGDYERITSLDLQGKFDDLVHDS